MNSELDNFLTSLPLSRKSEIITMLLQQVRRETRQKPKLPFTKEEDELVEKLSIIEQKLNPIIEADYVSNFPIESKIQNAVQYNRHDEIDNFKIVSLFLTNLVTLSKPEKLDESDDDLMCCISYLKSNNFQTFLSIVQHCSRVMYNKKLDDYENGNYLEEPVEKTNEYDFEIPGCPACHEDPCMCSDPQHNW